MPRTVLVVDDDPTIVQILREVLVGEGYAVTIARDGHAALHAIARDQPDLVVSDVMMPRVTGVQLIARLRRLGITIPVVLMSAAYADVDLPGVRFVPKPFDVDHLVEVVARELATSSSA
jgi:CheY-like chemotaxis protein